MQIASISRLISSTHGGRSRTCPPLGAGLFAHGVENPNSAAAKIQAHPQDHPMTLHVEDDDTYGRIVSLRHKKTGVLVGHLSEKNSTKDIFLDFFSEMERIVRRNPQSPMAALSTECCYTGVWTEKTRRHPVGFGVQGVITFDFFLKFDERLDHSRAVGMVAELQQIAQVSKTSGMVEITPCIEMGGVSGKSSRKLECSPSQGVAVAKKARKRRRRLQFRVKV